MGKYDGLQNIKFHRLLVLEYLGKDKGNFKIYHCICDCGKSKIVRASDLYNNKTKSCGCLRKEVVTIKNSIHKHIKHGNIKTSLYYIWQGIKQRCLNENCNSFKYYGGRKIVVCEEWINNFTNFQDWALQNGYKAGLTIDRIDNNGNYEPNNCQWIPLADNCIKHRKTVFITVNGITDTINGFDKRLGKYKREFYQKYHRKGKEHIEALISERLQQLN